MFDTHSVGFGVFLDISGGFFVGIILILLLASFRNNRKKTRKLTVSERKIAQQIQDFGDVLDAISDYAIYRVNLDGCVLSWNAGAQNITGWHADEVIGKHISLFHTHDDQTNKMPELSLSTALIEGRFETESNRVRKDGSVFWAHVIIDCIRDVNTKGVIGFVKITRDITKQKEAERKLIETSEQLLQSRKMDALGQLTGGIAHDFNNLLMVIGGSADMLARGKNVEKRIDNIKQAVARGQGLTRHLLSFARKQALDPKPVEVKQQLTVLRELLHRSLRADIRLTLNLPDDLWPIKIDADAFDTSLLNLGVNARDAMPKGGLIEISARNVTKMVQGNEIKYGEYVQISISDNGVGIASDVAARIFEPFYTTKEVGKGTGLGLAQVWSFMQQSGGTITTTSLLGEGTTFHLFFPRCLEIPERVHVSEFVPVIPQTMKGSVLIVEDDPGVAEVSTNFFEQMGYKVDYAASTQAALMIVEEKLPDIVFTDIILPGDIDGLGLAENLHERFPKIPIMLTTGYTPNADNAATFRFPLITKPYTFTSLAAFVEKSVQKQRQYG